VDLNFDVEGIEATEFGVYRNGGNGVTCVVVPSDRQVKRALGEMVVATREEMGNGDVETTRYEPSEKYGSKEYLYVPTDDHAVRALRDLHNAVNLPTQADALRNADAFSCYFARFVDEQERRLTAVRRAAYFKGILKSRNRLVRLVDDSLRIVEEDVFKLDNDFDLIMDSDNIHILRPAAFEIIADMREAILGAVPSNVASLREDVPFVDLSVVENYALKHPRAARYLQSISSGGHGRAVDRDKLVDLCRNTGVRIESENGVIAMDDANVMGFLEVLDRRRYGVDLVPQTPEIYKAARRQKVARRGASE